MRKLTDFADILLFFLPAAALMLFPAFFANTVRASLIRCVRQVIPAVFPFLVLTRLLSLFGVLRRVGRCLSGVLTRLFDVPPSLCGAMLLGMTAGFPNGAAACADAYESGICDADEAARAAALTNGASLPFMLFFAGKAVTGTMRFGVRLFAAQLVVNLLWARLHPTRVRTNGALLPSPVRVHFTDALTRGIRDATDIMLRVTGFIVFFSMLGDAAACFIRHPAIRAALLSLFEISAGLGAAAEADSIAKPVLAAFAVGICGLSALMQVSGMNTGAGIPITPYVSVRLYSSILLPLFACLPSATAVYALIGCAAALITAGAVQNRPKVDKRGKKVRKTTEKIGEKH